MSVYRVTGASNYRSHPPGSLFEATLDAKAEARAIRRGSITLVKMSKPALAEGSHKLGARGG